MQAGLDVTIIKNMEIDQQKSPISKFHHIYFIIEARIQQKQTKINQVLSTS